MTDTLKVITVALAAGRRAVSARLSEALTEVPGVACVLAADAAEAVRLVRAQPVDVILADLHIEPAGALGLLDPLLQVSPETRPVILVPPGGDFQPALLVAQGARGFLASDADGSLVRKCVNAVYGGEVLARARPGGRAAGTPADRRSGRLGPKPRAADPPRTRHRPRRPARGQ